MRVSVVIALILASYLTMNNSSKATQTASRLSGHYSDAQLAAVKGMTLPRTFLYSKENRLIPKEDWPAELAEVKKNGGDAYCCVSESDAPAKSDGPPENCVKIVYGTDIAENFKGLLKANGSPLTMQTLPPHKWLLVEYFATWCPPCVEERKALSAFFNSSKNASDYIWLSIDMSQMIDAKKKADLSK